MIFRKNFYFYTFLINSFGKGNINGLEDIILDEDQILTSPNYPDDIPIQTQMQWRITTEPGYRIKIYFFLCNIPESIFCQRLYLNVVDDQYQKRASVEDINRNRICGTCPQVMVSLSNAVTVILQSDAPENNELSRRFALRLEKTKEAPTMKNIRAATQSDPTPFPSVNSNTEEHSNTNSSMLEFWLKSANAVVPEETLKKAGETVTKLKSDNFWLALILSIIGFIFAVIFTVCICKKCVFRDIKSQEQRQMEWLRTVPHSFKARHMK